MIEIYEFTAEEMLGCPPFYIAGGNFFISCYVDQIEVQIPCSGNSGFEPRFVTHVKCNPNDRMMAICKHFFQLMPNADKIFVKGGSVSIHFEVKKPIDIGSNSEIVAWWEPLSINPFIGTERTQILREEVMNERTAP